MRDKFRTARGRLTHYALACGYIERHETPKQSVQLWHEGGPCFHVRQHHDARGRIFWETFERLGDARKCFDKAKRAIEGEG